MRRKVPASFKDKWRPVYHAALVALRPEGIPTALNGADVIQTSAVLRRPKWATHEPEVWKRLVEAVQPGDVCVDVGASIGWYTMGFANRLRGAGRVVSFEPDFPSHQMLQHHIDINGFGGVVCAMNVAAGDRDGILSFAGEGPTAHAAGPGEKPSVSVACFRLDTVFCGFGMAADIMKIDVEGFELEVLRGARQLLTASRRPRLIHIEVHPWAWPKLGLGTTPDLLKDFLNSVGYRFESSKQEFEDLIAWPE